jgi:hypothetical protein
VLKRMAKGIVGPYKKNHVFPPFFTMASPATRESA